MLMTGESGLPAELYRAWIQFAPESKLATCLWWARSPCAETRQCNVLQVLWECYSLLRHGPCETRKRSKTPCAQTYIFAALSGKLLPRWRSDSWQFILTASKQERARASLGSKSKLGIGSRKHDNSPTCLQNYKKMSHEQVYCNTGTLRERQLANNILQCNQWSQHLWQRILDAMSYGIFSAYFALFCYQFFCVFFLLSFPKVNDFCGYSHL